MMKQCCPAFWPLKKNNNQDIELNLIQSKPKRVNIKRPNINIRDQISVKQNLFDALPRQTRWAEFKRILDEQFQEYKQATTNQNQPRQSQINFISSRLYHMKFKVKEKLKISIVQGTKKYYYEVETTAGDSKWSSFILFGELYELALLLKEFYDVKKKPFVKNLLQKAHLNSFPSLTPLQYISHFDEILINKVPEIQEWFDTLSKEPYFLSEEFLTCLRCPKFVFAGYRTYRETFDKQNLQLDISCIQSNSSYHSQKISTPSSLNITSNYTYDIKMVKVECYSYERSQELRFVQNYLIKFYVQIAKTELLWECKRTWSEIKLIHQKLEDLLNLQIPYLKLYLSAYEQAQYGEKQQQIDKYLKALFSAKQYYCDILFDEYELVGQLMSSNQDKVEDLELKVLDDFTDDFVLPKGDFVNSESSVISLNHCTVRVRRILMVKGVMFYELGFCQYNDTFDNKVMEVIVSKTFSYLKQLQRSITGIYEGTNYKLTSKMQDEELDGRKMKSSIESFFLNILQLSRIEYHRPLMDCFHLWWIKEQNPKLTLYDFSDDMV